MEIKQSEVSLQRNIVFLSFTIWIFILIGFHKTYTIYFPNFIGFKWQQHFHGAILMSWFLLLIIQPLLIRFHQNKIHRTLGKISYILAPLVCYSIFLITRMVYFREILKRPVASVLGQISVDVPSIFIFGLFFILSMINRKNSSVHMRYMIATAFLFLGPGVARALIIFGGIPFPVAVQITLFMSDLLAILFLVYDIINKNSFKPLLTISILLISGHLCWIYQSSAIWQWIARGFIHIAS